MKHWNCDNLLFPAALAYPWVTRLPRYDWDSRDHHRCSMGPCITVQPETQSGSGARQDGYRAPGYPVPMRLLVAQADSKIHLTWKEMFYFDQHKWKSLFFPMEKQAKVKRIRQHHSISTSPDLGQENISCDICWAVLPLSDSALMVLEHIFNWIFLRLKHFPFKGCVYIYITAITPPFPLLSEYTVILIQTHPIYPLSLQAGQFMHSI